VVGGSAVICNRYYFPWIYIMGVVKFPSMLCHFMVRLLVVGMGHAAAYQTAAVPTAQFNTSIMLRTFATVVSFFA
jgi:hypothetical protein